MCLHEGQPLRRTRLRRRLACPRIQSKKVVQDSCPCKAGACTCSKTDSKFSVPNLELPGTSGNYSAASEDLGVPLAAPRPGVSSSRPTESKACFTRMISLFREICRTRQPHWSPTFVFCIYIYIWQCMHKAVMKDKPVG